MAKGLAKNKGCKHDWRYDRSTPRGDWYICSICKEEKLEKII